jgi:hypothetical protein
MAATESAQSYIQTCVIFMKRLVEYGRGRVCTDLH